MSIHTKVAFDYIRRAPFQAAAAIFVLTLTFFVATFVAILVYSSGRVLNYLETRPQIIAFLKDGLETQEVSRLQNELLADPRVKNVVYVSKEEALSIYKEATADSPLLSELVSPSIFPASLEFSLTDLSFAEAVIEEVKKEGIVEEVRSTISLGGEIDLDTAVTRLKRATSYVRIGGVTFVFVLSLTSFLVLLVIVGMRMTVRRDEVGILKLIGATKGFIKKPIVFEATLYAVIGVLLGWVLATLIILYASPTLIAYFGEIPILPKDTVQLLILLLEVLGVELLVGLTIAYLGASLAISRAQKSK